MSIGQRLKKLIEEKGLTVQNFAFTVQQSDASVYNYLANKTVPKLDLATAIMDAFPDLNPYWLLQGRGEMWLKEGEKAVPSMHAVDESDSGLSNTEKGQYEGKIKDLERIIESKDLVIKNQAEMIEMLRK